MNETTPMKNGPDRIVPADIQEERDRAFEATPVERRMPRWCGIHAWSAMLDWNDGQGWRCEACKLESRVQGLEGERDELNRELIAADTHAGEWVQRAEATESRLVRLEEAAQRLLDLKDGPRDAAYEAAKPKAWDELRAALTPSAPPSE